ncbi:hypothetical protein ASPWEDRAFT_716568 [Aspergillus wentii DTO 134E9]|uniref:Uncharacterized protein n=1 Tax=Aspergillus wentii DTO 134E9 TaxID=1073089 RepID=A0A1L9R6H4_ASPWE|nr:uncharacterized protein ASPWEDRAFT_716568 [Aspergillus wentii DTO 134E9]OJJ30509.1 hypothetical protein ASPWEDRAFT_716568 [Aspergillus wentii DTO 134E9]
MILNRIASIYRVALMLSDSPTSFSLMSTSTSREYQLALSPVGRRSSVIFIFIFLAFVLFLFFSSLRQTNGTLLSYPRSAYRAYRAYTGQRTGIRINESLRSKTHHNKNFAQIAQIVYGDFLADKRSRVFLI